MTSRILPPEEWHRLAGTAMEGIAERLRPDAGAILVLEEDGAIVATWALITMVHAEGLWIAPSHRGHAGLVRRLLRAMRELAAEWGCAAVQTGSVSDDVTSFILRLGGTMLPGHMFILPMTAKAMEDKCRLQ